MRFLQNFFKTPPKPSADEIQQRLMDAFDFDDSDLQANYQNRMSGKQRYWFLDRYLKQIFLSIAFVVVITLFCFSELQNPFPLLGSMGNLLFILVVFLTSIFTVIVWLWNLSLDLIGGGVRFIRGEGHIRLGRSRSWNPYQLHVEGLRFEIPRGKHTAFPVAEYYTVYYAPRSKIILAVEVEVQKTKNG